MSEQKDLTYEVDAYDVTWAIEENGEPCAKVGYQYEGVGEFPILKTAIIASSCLFTRRRFSVI